MRRMKLTFAGRLIAIFLVVVLVLGGTYAVGGFNFMKKSNSQTDGSDAGPVNNVPSVHDSNAMNISLDEWVGWKPIIDANGGLKTQPGSIFDKEGLKVNINVIDDATQSSNALIKGNLDGAGYTVNRLAFLYPKFKDSKVSVQMPFIVDASAGGDGIIAKQGINNVKDLVGKKIAVPRYSEAQTLIWWFIQKSDLTPEQIKQINMVMFDTPDDAAKAFFAGQVDAAATWQPYLSQAEQTSGAHILFSTKAAKNLVLDGMLFRKDYQDSHKDQVAKFIEGTLKAADLYTTSFTPIKNTMPLFATEKDEDIKTMTNDAVVTDYATNKDLLNGTAKSLYIDMANIWKGLGEKSIPGDVDAIFDSSILTTLSDKFPNQTVQTPTFTQAQRDTAQKQDNTQALLQKKFTINFASDTDAFANQGEAYKSMNELVEMAKILNGTVIQIEGNTNGSGDPQFLKDLSYKRAKAVATYLQFQGVDPTRLVIVGNGSDKPVAPNDTPENQAKNMRTDIAFKVVNH